MDNQRVRLSKRLLKDALIRLLQQNSIQKISIQEICQEAQINRTTFYKYYGNQYDLLNDIEKDLFDELQDCLKISDVERDGLTRVLVYFETVRDKVMLLLDSTSDKDFADKLFQLPVIKSLIEENTPKEYTEEQVKYLYTFTTQGGFAIIVQWIKQENRETPELMSRLVQELMARILSKNE